MLAPNALGQSASDHNESRAKRASFNRLSAKRVFASPRDFSIRLCHSSARRDAQAVATLHQQLDCIRQVLLCNVVVPTFAAQKGGKRRIARLRWRKRRNTWLTEPRVLIHHAVMASRRDRRITLHLSTTDTTHNRTSASSSRGLVRDGLLPVALLNCSLDVRCLINDAVTSCRRHSIIRSARFSTASGMLTPRLRATLRLITNSRREITVKGVLAGFAPLRTLSMTTGISG